MSQQHYDRYQKSEKDYINKLFLVEKILNCVCDKKYFQTSNARFFEVQKSPEYTSTVPLDTLLYFEVKIDNCEIDKIEYYCEIDKKNETCYTSEIVVIVIDDEINEKEGRIDFADDEIDREITCFNDDREINEIEVNEIVCSECVPFKHVNPNMMCPKHSLELVYRFGL